MTPEFAAGLVAFVGICLLAGWVTGFRNRSYVGWLGLAFVALAGSVLAAARAKEAKDLGTASPALATGAKILLLATVVAFLLSAVSAIRETARRLREIKQSHEAAAEGLLELVRAVREKGTEKQTEESRPASSDEDTV
jgi:uncharacterized membrane protein YhaH (DUF805 family)